MALVWSEILTNSFRCHGPAIFPGIIDSKTGKSIINGKNITGFTTQAEYDMSVMDAIRSWKEPLVDEWAEQLGAKCMICLTIIHVELIRLDASLTASNRFSI